MWYDFYNKTAILSKGSYFFITAPVHTIPLLVRGGYILPTQIPAVTTTLRYITPIYLFSYHYLFLLLYFTCSLNYECAT